MHNLVHPRAFEWVPNFRKAAPRTSRSEKKVKGFPNGIPIRGATLRVYAY